MVSVIIVLVLLATNLLNNQNPIDFGILRILAAASYNNQCLLLIE
jgi:hypothetical protein